MKKTLWYSLSQIADAYNRPISTTHNHIKELVKSRRFVKLSIGRYYDEEETRKIAELLKIPVEKLNLKANGK